MSAMRARPVADEQGVRDILGKSNSNEQPSQLFWHEDADDNSLDRLLQCRSALALKDVMIDSGN